MSACQVVVLISADAEWRAVTSLVSNGTPVSPDATPFGECLVTTLGGKDVLFLHGGWGKISAAASAQYAIDRWKPELLVNLGTCGGVEGEVEQGAILLVERTLVYDIVEQMGNFNEAVAHYTTELDVSWADASLPAGIRRSLLVSADRDLLPEDISRLKTSYGAVAADWESGAIAWTAARSQVSCLILRGVTDVVGPAGSEAYGDYALFTARTEAVMRRLLENLPFWLDQFFNNKKPHPG
jgi:adenosylhomocysteine nucleosidase